MKNIYRILQKVMIVMLVALIPLVSFAQDKAKEQKVRNTAPSHSYWSVGAFGGIMQFNGDLSKNLWVNLYSNSLGYNYGLVVTKQFTRVIGVRARIAHGMLQSRVENKFVYDYNGNGQPAYISQSFKSYPWETDLQFTVNWLNWALGYKPDRFFSSYVILGVGLDQTIGHKTDLLLAKDVAWIGQKDNVGNMGNTSGLAGHNLEFKVGAGLGFDFNINKHWSIPVELYWRWRDGDIVDMQPGGAKEIVNDMYSSATIGLTYKFAYSGCNLKEMANNYNQVKLETTPAVLSEKGDSVMVTVKGTVPPKYFCPTASMYFQPVVTYNGGKYDLKPMNIYGEKLSGDGTMIKYKEGGTFTYTTVFPYKPEMGVSQLSVAPVVYEAKEKILLKKDEIKVKAKFVELPSRDLAPGIIHTPTLIQHDEITLIADHGYQKEVFQSKTGIIYFKKNKFDLDLKYGINKTDLAKAGLTDFDAFVKQGWKIKDIAMNGWASPEGEETFNANLSENRSKTGNAYVISQFQAWAKEANKGNKDKKAVKAAVEAAGKDVNMVLQHHGPDWNGFLKAVQNSDLKDKDKILNVINSNADQLKKEAEIRNMILIYPEIESKLLPPLRRVEITGTLYEPRLTDVEISQYAVSNPDKLKVEELLYAATLTNDVNAKVTITENAVKQFPNNWKALNNAAVAQVSKGNLGRASELLNKAQGIAPNNGIIENNIGVIAAKQGDLKKAEAQFKKAATLGENTNYNQGVLLIPKGDYPKAITMLSNAKCSYNLGLAQLVSGNTSAAETTLKCAPQTPDTYYLLAVIGARTNNTKTMYENLMKACQDSKMKTQAKNDREFYSFANSPEFLNIVK
ncbi:MAG: hypothetical protein M0P47_08435 [Bacteroidales bacterium]|nr:hypothetical protein [Bacteroidales bacterium]